MNVKKISFVIACYNSENSLKNVVDEIVSTLDSKPSIDYEVILVNDGSNDGTFGVIELLCKDDVRIKGVNLSRNFGQLSAMLSGFSVATGDVVAYCDDDGQCPVNDIFVFIEKLEEGFDMVWAKFEVKESSLFSKIGSKVNDIMVNLLLDKPKDLSLGNLWVARKFVIDEAVKCQNPMPYLSGLFLKITSNMANVTTTQRKRAHGTSNYSLLKLISIWINGFTAYSIVPLRIASFIGACSALSGFAYVIYLVHQKIVNPEILMGYSSIMAVNLLIGGMIMIMLGLLGEYIGRIYMNVNNMPQYVVKQKVNL